MLKLGGAVYPVFLIAAALFVCPLAYLSYVLFETPCRRRISRVEWPPKTTAANAPAVVT